MAKEKLVKDQDKVIVRLPDGMRDWLKEAATKNDRSMNAEIVARLRSSFEEGFSDEDLMASIRDLIIAKRVQDLLGDEVAEGISAYATHVSNQSRWGEALEELLRWALIDVGVMSPDRGEERPISTFVGAANRWAYESRRKADEGDDE